MKCETYKLVVAALAVVCVAIGGAVVVACPFCDAPAQTLSEETASADAVVLAKLIKEAPPVGDSADPNSGTATLWWWKISGNRRSPDAVAANVTRVQRIRCVPGLPFPSSNSPPYPSRNSTLTRCPHV